jgi:hypothetical protein
VSFRGFRPGKPALITTITEWTAAPAALLAQACQQRWEHEHGNKQLKTYLRGPGPHPAVPQPGHGPPGDLRLPPHSLGAPGHLPCGRG